MLQIESNNFLMMIYLSSPIYDDYSPSNIFYTLYIQILFFNMSDALVNTQIVSIKAMLFILYIHEATRFFLPSSPS